MENLTQNDEVFKETEIKNYKENEWKI